MWLASLSLLAAQAAPASADTIDVYEQRLMARAGDEACALLAPTERALLDAAIRRSRDDAVLQGATPDQLDRFETRIDTGFAADCTAAEALPGVAAHRAQIERLSGFDEARFEGRVQGWTARRGAMNADRAGWRVVQAISGGDALFGIFQDGEEAGIALALRSAQPSAYAVAVLRDPAREPFAVDLTAGGLLPPPGLDPISRWGAPSDRQARVFATQSLPAARAAQLAPAFGEPAYGFRFPDDFAARLIALAPREGVHIDLHDASGAVTARYWIEVGALDAALAFLALPEPVEPEPQPLAP